MARSFSIVEKERIKALLIDKGRSLFIQYGLKKTTIDDITREVGISKGSFYSFYSNKEELYFEILEIEEGVRQQVVEQLLLNQIPVKEAFIEILEDGFQFIEENPIIRILYKRNELNQLMQRIPPEKLKQHRDDNSHYALSLFYKWQEQGKLKDEPKELISGIMRAIAAISLNRDIVGNDIYREVISWLIRVIADKLVTDESVE